MRDESRMLTGVRVCADMGGSREEVMFDFIPLRSEAVSTDSEVNDLNTFSRDVLALEEKHHSFHFNWAGWRGSWGALQLHVELPMTSLHCSNNFGGEGSSKLLGLLCLKGFDLLLDPGKWFLSILIVQSCKCS